MAAEVPCATYMALYIISMHIVNSNGRSSSSHHWKLNLSSGTVEQAPAKAGNSSSNNTTNSNNSGLYDGPARSETNEDVLFNEIAAEERMMGILSNRVFSGQGGGMEWIVMGDADSKGSQKEDDVKDRTNCVSSVNCNTKDSATTDFHKRDLNEQRHSKSFKASKKPPALTCGKPVNSSQYDNLTGISERHHHHHVPEPDVAMVFKAYGKSTDVDMAQLESKLRKARQDIIASGDPLSEKSCHVYNLIGNFWRIKGDTQKSIECFRKALSILPEDPDFLLNLARVLFNLQYLDDAIVLARKSLLHQPVGGNSWLQHYTLGEILKAYGDLPQAVTHFRQAAELNPGFQPTRSHLRELTDDPHLSVTHLTLFIILSLVVGVLSFLLLSVESNFLDAGGVGSGGSTSETPKSLPRHFNRAMAMRSIKLGINPRMYRLRNNKSHA